MMKLFVREDMRIALVILAVMVVASGLTGGSAGAVYLTAIACMAVVGWREKRKESR